MNDESNDESIKRLQSNVSANIFYEFLMLQYGCEISEDLDLNLKDYELYKNSLKNDDKEEAVEFNCDDQMNIFCLIITRQDPSIVTKRMLLT